VLSYSWRLILAPTFVLNYLAAHEVAHLVEMNHSARFWRLVQRLCPDHERAKVWLDVHGSDLHRYGIPEGRSRAV
jgi:predicted metal-dependent hydrolase